MICYITERIGGVTQHDEPFNFLYNSIGIEASTFQLEHTAASNLKQALHQPSTPNFNNFADTLPTPKRVQTANLLPDAQVAPLCEVVE